MTAEDVQLLQGGFDSVGFLKCQAKTNGRACSREAGFIGHCKTRSCAGTIGQICGSRMDRAALRRWRCTTCGARGWFRDIHTLIPIGAA